MKAMKNTIDTMSSTLPTSRREGSSIGVSGSVSGEERSKMNQRTNWNLCVSDNTFPEKVWTIFSNVTLRKMMEYNETRSVEYK